MIRTNTWIVVGIFALAVLAASLFNRSKEAKAELEALATPVDESTVLFSPEDGQPESIEVSASTGETAEIGRDSTGQWVVTAPRIGPADQGLAEAAAAQLTALQVLEPAVDVEPDLLGLSRPSYVVIVTFTSGRIHKLDIGDLTPSESGYYARLDGQQPFIVSAFGLEPILGLTFAPPYAPTPEGVVPLPDFTPTP